MKKTPQTVSVILLAALILSACNLPSKDPGVQGSSAAMTAAAQTVAAQLTAIAPINTATVPVIVPSTNTPISVPPTAIIPSATSLPPTATPTCDLGKFITDVNIPDGTVMTPSQAFTKTWRIQNIGACSWTGYSLVFDTGDAMGGAASSAIGTTPSNGTVDISINLTAPASPGNYRGYWRIRSGAGVLFPIVSGYQGKSFYVDIKVQSPATATSTLPPAIVFAVTGVTYSVSTWSSGGSVNCPRITANITTNAAGSVDYHWTRSDGAGGSTSTLVFGSAGTQSISADWQLGSVWAPAPDEWMGIYIDTPNHQDFGHAVMPACTTP